MIIHEPTITKCDGWVRLSARLESTRHPDLSGDLWFEFRESVEKFLSTRSDAFLTAGFLAAMRLGEDIEVRGEVSPTLLRGIAVCQEYFEGGRPKSFRRVSIRADRLSPVPAIANPLTVSAFSGGVDSFFTLMRHARSRQSQAPLIDRGLLMHGFDIPLSDQRSFDIMEKQYRQTLDGLGISLMVGRTNFRNLPLTGLLDWEIACTASLIGAAHSLSLGIGTFLVPASFTARETIFSGSTPETDEALSTEALIVIHDGFDTDRADKTWSLAEEPTAYEALRVCFTKPDGVTNCCLCPKCRNVMAIMDIAGTLGRFKTFPLPLYAAGPVLFQTGGMALRADKIVELATKAGRQDIIDDYLGEKRRFERRDAIVTAILTPFPKTIAGISVHKHALRLAHLPLLWLLRRDQRRRLKQIEAARLAKSQDL